MLWGFIGSFSVLGSDYLLRSSPVCRGWSRWRRSLLALYLGLSFLAICLTANSVWRELHAEQTVYVNGPNGTCLPVTVRR